MVRCVRLLFVAFALFRQSWACGWQNWWRGGLLGFNFAVPFDDNSNKFQGVLWWGFSFHLLVLRIQMSASGIRTNPFSKANVWVRECAKIVWWKFNFFPFCGRLRLNLQTCRFSSWAWNWTNLLITSPMDFCLLWAELVVGGQPSSPGHQGWNPGRGPKLGTHNGDVVKAG